MIKRISSVDRVADELKSLNLPVTVQELPDSTRTAKEAAAAAKCQESQIVKSLVFQTVTSQKPILILYSVALVIVEAVMGSHLFGGATVADRLTAQLRDDVTPKRLCNVGVPPAPARVIARALSRNPAERPQTAASFLQDLTTSQSSPGNVPTLLNAVAPSPAVVPPPKAEEMYHPETFGRGPGDRLIVE